VIPWYAVVVIGFAAWAVGIGFGIAIRDWRPGEFCEERDPRLSRREPE
jgi:hypothetical protein